MDREKIIELKKLLDSLVGNGVPSEEDLDFDEDAIEMYDAMQNLLETIEEYGL